MNYEILDYLAFMKKQYYRKYFNAYYTVLGWYQFIFESYVGMDYFYR